MTCTNGFSPPTREENHDSFSQSVDVVSYSIVLHLQLYSDYLFVESLKFSCKYQLKYAINIVVVKFPLASTLTIAYVFILYLIIFSALSIYFTVMFAADNIFIKISISLFVYTDL